MHAKAIGNLEQEMAGGEQVREVGLWLELYRSSAWLTVLGSMGVGVVGIAVTRCGSAGFS